MIDKKMLSRAVSSYKSAFDDHDWEKEEYKWRAVKTFQDNWNIDDENFSEMLKKSLAGTKNILDSRALPGLMITIFAKYFPEEVREMFVNLFDENRDTYDRIHTFKEQSETILSKYKEQVDDPQCKNHFQDEHAITVYLWLRYPDKYSPYKFTVYREVAKKLNTDYVFKNRRYKDNINNYLKLSREILEIVKKANDLISLFNSHLTPEHYSDPNFITLTGDLIMYIGKEFHVPTPPTDRTVKMTETLLTSKNIIFHGAPGTGKTYLAKQIASNIVSGGRTDKFDDLTEEEQQRIGFVQFHPSYDYTDFVEGLRPIIDSSGKMSFILKDGVFREFVDRARKNYEDSKKNKTDIKSKNTAEEKISLFLSREDLFTIPFYTKSGNAFYIKGYDENNIFILIPSNQIVSELRLSIEKLKTLVTANKIFNTVNEIKKIFKQNLNTQDNSYYFVLANEISKITANVSASTVDLKDYVFIIDEINRGEISKIFGELFFSIDPGYRGEKGSVCTQYSNLRDDRDRQFYIPENVYIIGTMNDIDRSVDNFDFAMRRRFRFINISAEESTDMLSELGELQNDAVEKMTKLNEKIATTEELGENYQIGASYFLKATDISFNELWYDYLRPLLFDYVQGFENCNELMKNFEKAYGLDEYESD